MASGSRAFNCSRALFAASKAATPIPKLSPAAGKKPAAAPAPKPSPADAAAAAEKKKIKVRKTYTYTNTKPPGICKAMPISPALRNFLGVPESSRVEAIKKLWGYIKLHNLQNPKDKKEIILDDKLKKIFEGKEKVGIFEVAKLLNPHFVYTIEG